MASKFSEVQKRPLFMQVTRIGAEAGRFVHLRMCSRGYPPTSQQRQFGSTGFGLGGSRPAWCHAFAFSSSPSMFIKGSNRRLFVPGVSLR